MRTPSQTARGRQWVENFDESDQSTARLLIDSLEIASYEEVRHGIIQLISDQATSEKTLIIPIQGLEDVVPYRCQFGDERKTDRCCVRGHEVRRSREQQRKLIAFEDFDPFGRIDLLPGSEGSIGTIVREAGRANSGHIVTPQANEQLDLSAIADRRIRKVSFVTDSLGSGDQALGFVMSFLRNSRFRSWRSYRYVEIEIMSYSGSVQAVKRIEGKKIGFRHVRASPTIESVPWGIGTKAKVIQFCKRYKGKRPALGYRQSGGLFATTISSVPNNLPGVLMRNRSRDWVPFFDGRSFPLDLMQEIDGFQPSADFNKTIERINNGSMNVKMRKQNGSRTAGWMTAALLVLYQRPFISLQEFSLELSLPIADAVAISDFFRINGIMTSKFALTIGGVKLLGDTYLRESRDGAERLAPSCHPYYPMGLR